MHPPFEPCTHRARQVPGQPPKITPLSLSAQCDGQRRGPGRLAARSPGVRHVHHRTRGAGRAFHRPAAHEWVPDADPQCLIAPHLVPNISHVAGTTWIASEVVVPHQNDRQKRTGISDELMYQSPMAADIPVPVCSLHREAATGLRVALASTAERGSSWGLCARGGADSVQSWQISMRLSPWFCRLRGRGRSGQPQRRQLVARGGDVDHGAEVRAHRQGGCPARRPRHPFVPFTAIRQCVHR